MEIRILVPAFLVAMAFLAVKFSKLSAKAGIVGVCLSSIIFYGGGTSALIMLFVFFGLGTVATSWKYSVKSDLGPEAASSGPRDQNQVLANAGFAAVAALAVFIFPETEGLCRLIIAASFSSATADTLSSEFGNVYGSKFYNVINWKPDTRGENGVVSLEGTVAGIFGSMIIAIAYGIIEGFDINFLYIVLCGVTGCFIDSVLGATMERRGILSNNSVNFLNTLTAGLLMLLFQFIN